MKLREVLEHIGESVPMIIIRLRDGIEVCTDRVSAMCMLKDCLLDSEAKISDSRNDEDNLFGMAVAVDVKEDEKIHPTVVRCKDCRYWRQEVDNETHWVCTQHSCGERIMHTTPDFYCADGKRAKEDEKDD